MDPVTPDDDIQAATREHTFGLLAAAVQGHDSLGVINALGVLRSKRWRVPPSVLGPLLLTASQYDEPGTFRVLIGDQTRTHDMSLVGKKNKSDVGPLVEAWVGVTARLKPDVAQRAHQMVRTAVEWGYSDVSISKGAVQMLLAAGQHALLVDWMTEAAQADLGTRSSRLPSPSSVLTQAAIMDCVEVVDAILDRNLVHGIVLACVATEILEDCRGGRAHLERVLPKILEHRTPVEPGTIGYERFSLVATLKQALGVPLMMGLGLCEDIVSRMDAHEVELSLRDPSWMQEVVAGAQSLHRGIDWSERVALVTSALNLRRNVLELEAATAHTPGSTTPTANRRM